jgi:ketosteroid isomerase-like protein
MAIEDVANGLVNLCREGKFSEAFETYYAENVVSIEPISGPDMPAEISGKDNVRKKGEWWEANNEVHSVKIEGPMIGGNQFSMLMSLDVTYKPDNQRMDMNEMCLYDVEDGKIVKERFFYHMPGM